MTAGSYTSSTPLQANGKNVDILVRLTMARFAAAGIFAHPMKVAKVAKKALRLYPSLQVATKVLEQYFQAAEVANWEEYARAYEGADARRFIHVRNDVR